MHALEKFGLAPLASFGTSTSSALLCGVCAAVGTYLEAVFLEQVWALGMEPVKVEVDGRWRDTSYLQGAGADPA